MGFKKQPPAVTKNDAMKAVRVNQNSKVAGGQLNNELKLTIKLSKAEGSFRFEWKFSGSSLRATTFTFSIDFVIIKIQIIAALSSN